MALLVAMFVLATVAVAQTVSERRYQGPTRRYGDVPLGKRFAIGFGEVVPSIVIGAALSKMPSNLSDVLAGVVLVSTARYGLHQTRRPDPDEGTPPW